MIMYLRITVTQLILAAIFIFRFFVFREISSAIYFQY